MSDYAPTEFNADQWEVEPLTYEEEEQRLWDCFSAYVQRYQGDRDLTWLQDQAFDRSFGSSRWEGDHSLIQMFVEFTRCVVSMDEHDDQPRVVRRRIHNFFRTYNGVSSTNPDIQDILQEMRRNLQNRREHLRILEGDTESNSTSRSSSRSSSSSR